VSRRAKRSKKRGSFTWKGRNEMPTWLMVLLVLLLVLMFLIVTGTITWNGL
jgi:uncharacterized membrane protein